MRIFLCSVLRFPGSVKTLSLQMWKKSFQSAWIRCLLRWAHLMLSNRMLVTVLNDELQLLNPRVFYSGRIRVTYIIAVCWHTGLTKVGIRWIINIKKSCCFYVIFTSMDKHFIKQTSDSHVSVCLDHMRNLLQILISGIWAEYYPHFLKGLRYCCYYQFLILRA